MKVMCFVEGEPSVHIISDVFYSDEKVVMWLSDGNNYLYAVCKDKKIYGTIVENLYTHGAVSINNSLNFSIAS